MADAPRPGTPTREDVTVAFAAYQLMDSSKLSAEDRKRFLDDAVRMYRTWYATFAIREDQD